MNGRKTLALISLVILGLIGCSPKETTSANAETPMKITGEAFYRERIAMPPNAQVDILLEDISRADAPATIIGSQTLSNAGQPPYAFSIDYRPSDLIPGHRYNLRARLTVNGELQFITDQAHPVFIEGQENQTKLLMRRVPHQAPPAAAETTSETTTETTTETIELVNTYWKLLTLNGQEVTPGKHQREPNLVFAGDMRVSGSDGCNNMSGSYTVDGSQIILSQMLSTQRACIEGGEQAHAFTMALSAIKSYRIDGDKLELLDEGGTPSATFIAVALQ